MPQLLSILVRPKNIKISKIQPSSSSRHYVKTYNYVDIITRRLFFFELPKEHNVLYVEFKIQTKTCMTVCSQLYAYSIWLMKRL